LVQVFLKNHFINGFQDNFEELVADDVTGRFAAFIKE